MRPIAPKPVFNAIFFIAAYARNAGAVGVFIINYEPVAATDAALRSPAPGMRREGC